MNTQPQLDGPSETVPSHPRPVRTMHELVDRLELDQPHFHRWQDGRPANWAIAPDVLRSLAEQLRPGMNTLETGAGQTTVVFAGSGTHHVVVTPDEHQTERIRQYLSRVGIEGDLTFIHASSDAALPAGTDIPERLDLVLIDGAHRFPLPVIDWHYTEARVPVGGMVVVDDAKMPSVRILHDFLDGEDDWMLERELRTTSFFRRVRRQENTRDWADQNINRAHFGRILAGEEQENAPLKRWFGKWLPSRR
jgi:Methyltransferase domain